MASHPNDPARPSALAGTSRSQSSEKNLGQTDIDLTTNNCNPHSALHSPFAHLALKESKTFVIPSNPYNCATLNSGLRNSVEGSRPFLRGCKIEDCRADNSTLAKGSEVHGGLFKSRQILNSGISEAAFVEGELTDREAQKGTFHETSFVECELSEEMSVPDGKKVSAPLTFRWFPVEIRKIIFDNAIEDETFSVPNLVVALRGDSKLYFEAFEVLYKKSYVPVQAVHLLGNFARKKVTRLFLEYV